VKSHFGGSFKRAQVRKSAAARRFEHGVGQALIPALISTKNEVKRTSIEKVMAV
jgi:hypothetical protein